MENIKQAFDLLDIYGKHSMTTHRICTEARKELIQISAVIQSAYRGKKDPSEDRTHKQIALEFLKKHTYCTVLGLNNITNSNYSHSNIIRPLQEAGIISYETRKLDSDNAGNVLLYRTVEGLDWNKVDMDKCCLS